MEVPDAIDTRFDAAALADAVSGSGVLPPLKSSKVMYERELGVSTLWRRERVLELLVTLWRILPPTGARSCAPS
jgi:hypothetical protein